jgi:TolA-binding protein
MRALAALLLLGLLTPARAEVEGDSARFDAAIALEGKGDLTAAVGALEAFARELPDHALAPDALAEAASLCEGRLHDPARALADWRLLADRYPQSRGARRAVLRKTELEALIGGGADPRALGAYQQLIDEAGSPARPEARAAVRAFLDAHPDFPLRDAGLYWLGHTAEQLSHDEEAIADYDAAIAIGKSAAPRAARAKMELLLRLGRLDEARAALAVLSRYGDPVSRQAYVAGTEAVRAVTARARWATTALVALLIWALGMAALARRALWPPPREARFFVPVGLLFAIAALSEHRAIARTVIEIAIGATAILWLSGSARQRPRGFFATLAIALSTALAIVALTYAAVHWNGLIDLVLETWRSGPDR